jgi:hypothetical protein
LERCRSLEFLDYGWQAVTLGESGSKPTEKPVVLEDMHKEFATLGRLGVQNHKWFTLKRGKEPVNASGFITTLFCFETSVFVALVHAGIS